MQVCNTGLLSEYTRSWLYAGFLSQHIGYPTIQPVASRYAIINPLRPHVNIWYVAENMWSVSLYLDNVIMPRKTLLRLLSNVALTVC